VIPINALSGDFVAAEVDNRDDIDFDLLLVGGSSIVGFSMAGTCFCALRFQHGL